MITKLKDQGKLIKKNLGTCFASLTDEAKQEVNKVQTKKVTTKKTKTNTTTKHHGITCIKQAHST